MITLCKTLDDHQIELLRGLIGSQLKSYDAALAAPPDIAWNSVRLHTSAACVDINCLLANVAIDGYGNKDEHGIISIASGQDETLDVPEVSCDTSIFRVDKPITGISLVTETLSVFNHGSSFYQATTTKSVIIHLPDDIIVLDRQAWFDESLAIGRGTNFDELIFDEWADWEDDEEEEPGVHYESSIEIGRI